MESPSRTATMEMECVRATPDRLRDLEGGCRKASPVLLALILQACASTTGPGPAALQPGEPSAQGKLEPASDRVGGLELSGEALYLEGIWLGSHERMMLGGYVPRGHASERWRHRLFAGGLRKVNARIGADVAYDQALYALELHADDAVQVDVQVPSYPEFPAMLITAQDGFDHLGLVDIVWQHGPSLLRASAGGPWTANSSSFLSQDVEVNSSDDPGSFYNLVDAISLDSGALLAIGAPGAPWLPWGPSFALRPTGEIEAVAGRLGRLPLSFRIDSGRGPTTLPWPDLSYTPTAGAALGQLGIEGSGARARFSVAQEPTGRLKRLQLSEEVESLIESAEKDFPIVSVHSGDFTGSRLVDVLASPSPGGWDLTGLMFSRSGDPTLLSGPAIHVEAAAEAVAGFGLTDLNSDGVRDAAVLLVEDAHPAGSIVVLLCGSTGASLGVVRLSAPAPGLSFGYLAFDDGDGVALIGAPEVTVGEYREAGLVLALSCRGSEGAVLSAADSE